MLPRRALLISWEIFSVRIQLADLPPRSAPEWDAWARKNERVVSFRTKHRWRQARRATGRLDSAHKQARALLAAGWAPSAAVHGFVRTKSTKSAAMVHSGARAALTLDLADFFGQVTFNRVVDNLRMRFDDRSCDWIEGACFRDGAIPLGYRTSPALSNLAFSLTDDEIADVARRHGVAYTRWVDDLTFSGAGVSDQLLADVQRTLAGQGWAVNDRKTRFMRRSPYVLGLYVGHDVDRPRLPRRMKQRLLVETYHFSRLGFEHFSHEGVMSPSRLFGRVAYASVIEPELAELLNERVDAGHRVGRS
ncbi:reverse transcriptase family protein [Microbacterium sp. SLBN-154]|uniref:reverse transcriptase family protein n=1 Tax=Microbacterium sp. SLBN-154 TaxID=2768458 RepID=UPI0022858531|nr:reverse transcriptase family protein [Microbacterium sp. SLBN-154]